LGAVPVPIEVDEELAFHLEMQTRRFIDAGLSAADARREALRRFGDVAGARAECVSIGYSMEANMRRAELRQELRQDAAYAWRQMRRNPAFTLVALLTIALGIGANAAIFSVVNTVLLRPLPYRDADRVLGIWNQTASGLVGQWAMSAPEFADIQEQQHQFSGVSALRPQRAALTGACGPADCEPESVTAYAVSPNFFEVLGASPLRGRGFQPADGQDGSERVAVLSHSLWTRRYGADSTIIGRGIEVNGIVRTVVGIMPPDVRFPDAPLGFLKERADVWLPFAWERSRGDSRGNQILATIARLRPGASLDAARADLSVIASRFRAQFPARYAKNDGWRLTAISLRDQMVGDVRLGLIVLSTTVGLVLLIACVNVANLLLARGAARRQELAVRVALGAGRGRIARQLLTESMVLGLAGGVLGVLLAWGGVRLILILDPAHLPRLDAVRIDGTVLAYSLGLSLATGFLFGLAPALQHWRTYPHDALQSAGRGTIGSLGRGRLRYGLVVAEIAMALVVLVGAGLLVRSFAAMQRVPTGFDDRDVMTMQLTLPRARYDSAFKLTTFARDLSAQLAAAPGVEAVSAVYPLPMSGEGWSGSFDVEGLTVTSGQQEPHAEFAVALPGYLGAMRIRLLAGRDLLPSDDDRAPRVVLVDEALARRYWPGESAVGKRINGNERAGEWETIIGVVGHVHNAGPQSEGEPQIYLPYLQHPQGPLFPVMRMRAGATVPVSSLRAAVRAVDQQLPVTSPRSMRDVVSRAVARQRFNAVLLAAFGIVALILAAIGLYGVMSFVVAQRAHEIGIRLALGGSPRKVISMMLQQGLTLSILGLVGGLVVSAAATRVLATLVFGIGATDAITYAGVSALLLAVAAVACYLPARRVTRVDPVAAMRSEA
jgi:putative ABC transport system permease protein